MQKYIILFFFRKINTYFSKFKIFFHAGEILTEEKGRIHGSKPLGNRIMSTR